MIPPISEPASPSPIVAYHGIGSGPGRAKRARPPTTKPQMTAPMMKASTRRLWRHALSQLPPNVKDALQDRDPRCRSQERNRADEEPDAERREHEAGGDHDDALGAGADADVAAQPERLRTRARVADEEGADHRREHERQRH